MRKLLTIAVLGLAMALGSSAAVFAAVGDPTEVPNSGNADPITGAYSEFDPDADVDTTGSLQGDQVTTDEGRDNELTNANNSGTGTGDNSGNSVGEVIKSDDMVDNNGVAGTQRTHGEYQNNTNSCASCHQTHTGSAKNLLFKDGVYSTCTACHDGTLGFYNVYEASTAGTFGGDATKDGSIHMANDAVTVSAAPGGKRTGTEEASWGKEFNCASCHSAHGSYSDRLLNYNPNNMAATSSKEGGNAAWSKIYTDLAVVEADVAAKLAADPNYNPNKDYGKYILVKQNAGDIVLVADDPATTTVDETVTLASKYGEATTEPVIISYGFKLDHGHYTLERAIAPILYAYEYAKPYKAYESRLFQLTNPDADADGNGVPDEIEAITWPYTDAAIEAKIYDGNDAAAVITMNLQGGYIKGSALTTANYGQIARAYVVDLDMQQYPTDLGANAMFQPGGAYSYISDANLGVRDFGGIAITYSQDKTLWGYTAGGKGIALSGYCAACHTDYLASSGKETGEFSTAYRHTTETDSYTCIRCHYAHGTDRNLMADAQGRNMTDLTSETFMGVGNAMTPAEADAWMDDKNTSSALKKFTNMAGCWSCHNSSHASQLINNPDTTANQTTINKAWSADKKVVE